MTNALAYLDGALNVIVDCRHLVILSQNALYLALTLGRNKLEYFVPGNPFQKLKVFRGGCNPYLQHHAIIKKFVGDKHSSLLVLKSF